MFCTNCGASNKEDAKFCVNCGETCDELKRKERFLRTALVFFKQISFLKALFIFSFDGVVTSKIIKFLYGLSILLAGVIGFIFVMVGLYSQTRVGILAFVCAPLIFLLMVIYSRVLLEMMIAIFRMANHPTHAIGKSESKDSIQWNIE